MSIYLTNNKDIFSLGHGLLSKNNCAFIWPRLKMSQWSQSVDDAGSLTCYSCDPLDPSSKPHLLKSWKIYLWGKHFPHQTSTDHVLLGVNVWLSLSGVFHFICRNCLWLTGATPMCSHSLAWNCLQNGDPIMWMIWYESQYSFNLLRNFSLSASAFLSVVLSVRTTEVLLLCNGGRPAWRHSPAFHGLWILQEPPWL